MKILYWVNGNATLADKRNAQALGAFIRNARAWHSRDTVETCDQVAGDPPPAYQHLPRAEVPKPPAKKPQRRSVSRRGQALPKANSEPSSDQATPLSPSTPPPSTSDTI